MISTIDAGLERERGAEAVIGWDVAEGAVGWEAAGGDVG